MRLSLILLLVAGCGGGTTGGDDASTSSDLSGGSDGSASADLSSGGAIDMSILGSTDLALPGIDPLEVDVAAVVGAIHPEIYGLAFADKQTLTTLNIPLNRWGGNSTTRFNWQLDVHNTGSDYFYENIANGGEGVFGMPSYVATSDMFVRDNNSSKSATLMTIPTIGWTPKDRVANHPFTCGFPVSKYGAQQQVDPWDVNCGNGVTQAGKDIAGDPLNTSIAAPPSFESMWITHLVGKFGGANAGGVRFYALDNEMNLWSSTHRDVHPKHVTYDEIWQTTTMYAPVIRAGDPGATILGYGSWGVLDLFASALDTANMNTNDQQAHGNQPLAKWYLAQLAAHEKQNGSRLIDCLDVHYYPQGGDPLQTMRSLWDPTYRDPSWIDQWLGEPVRLFPRLNEWIAATYPGTKICVSEYNWNLGKESDPLSALSQADLLGIYGRYGVRLAAYWTTPVDQGKLLPPAEAFRLYRNYDGAGSTFAPISVAAASTLTDVSLYAATDGGASKVTLVVVNKRANPVTATLALRNFAPAASAKAFQYQAQANATVTPIADIPVAGGKLALDLPARSMTLLAIPKQ